MITLQAPYDSPLYFITIKNPELFDNLILNTRVTFIKAMDGSTYGFKKTPALKKHVLRFINLSRRKGLEIINFLNQSKAGPDWKYIDKDGTIWRGLILDTVNNLTTYGIGRSGYNTERAEAGEITINFQGVIDTVNTNVARSLSGLRSFESESPLLSEETNQPIIGA